MIPKKPLATAIILCLTAFASAQAPVLESIVPTGPRLTDASLIDFEASFSKPVVGVTAGQFLLEGTHGGSPSLEVNPVFGQSLELTSTSQRAVATGVITNTNFTVEFWANQTFGANGGNGTIVSLAVGSEDNALLFQAGGGFWRGGTPFNFPNVALGLNEWTHVAIVVQGTTIRIYIDGQLERTTFAPSTPGSGVLVLGDDQDCLAGCYDASQAFIGLIDELRIWATARSTAEIQANYRSTVPTTAAGLSYYWRFDSTGDFGAGLPGSNDVEDLHDSSDFDLINSAALAPSPAPSSTWTITADMSSATAGSLGLDVAATTIEDLDGTPLAANAARLDQWVEFTDCSAPVPTTSRIVESMRPNPVTVTFDKPVVGFDASDFDIGGVAPNGAAITSVTSTFGAALELSTPNSFASSGLNAFPVFTDDFTVEAWFRTTKSDAGVISFATSAAINALLIQAGGRVFVNGNIVLSPLNVGQLDGEWHHIAVSVTSGGDIVRYIDGLVAGRAANAVTNFTASGVLVLGQDQDILGGGFETAQAIEGDVDEVRLWEAIRTPTEIFNHYDIQVIPNAAVLSHYYRFDALEMLGVGSNGGDVRDLAGSADLDTSFATTAAFIDRGTTLDIELAFASARTAFVEIDLDVAHDIQGRCGTLVAPANGPLIDFASTEDLLVSVEVNGGSPELVETTVAPGDQMVINFASPGGTHDFVAVPSLFGQLIVTGTTPGNVGAFGFPELRLDLLSPSAPFIVFDGNNSGLFGPTFLPPGGISFVALAPIGLAGISLVCQPIASSSTSTANNIFATGNALVINL